MRDGEEPEEYIEEDDQDDQEDQDDRDDQEDEILLVHQKADSFSDSSVV